MSIQPAKKDAAIVQKKTAPKNPGLRLWTILSVLLTAVSITLWSVLNYFMTMYQLQRFNENGGQADVIGTMLELPLSLIIVPMMAAVFMTVAFDGSRVKNKGQRKWPAGKITAIVLGWLLLVTLVFWVGQQFAGMGWRPLASDIIYPASSAFERLLLGGYIGTGLLAIPWACLLMYLPAALAARFGFCYKKDVSWKDVPERTWLPIPEHKIGGLLLAAAVMFSIKNNLNTRSYFMGMSNIVYYLALVIPLAVEAVIFTVQLSKGKDFKMAVYIGISVGILVQLLIPAVTGISLYSWEGILTMQAVPSMLLYAMMKALENSSGWRKKLGTVAAVVAGVPALMAVLGSFGGASVNLFSVGDRRMLAVWMFYMIPAGVAAFVVWRLQKIRSQRVVAVWRQQKIRNYRVAVPVLFGVLIGGCMMMIIFNTPFVSSYYVGYGQFDARMAVEQCMQFSIGGGYLIYFAGRRKSVNQ